MPRRRKFNDEFIERAVRLVAESGRPITHVAGDLGVGSESLRKWVRQAEADAGKQPAVLKTSEREELAKLRAEVKDLRRANDILKAASVFLLASSTHADRGERVHR
jgi:transposase